MGLRISKRINLGKGVGVNLSKGGVSVSKRGKRGSVGVGSKGTPRGSVRVARGISWTWGKR